MITAICLLAGYSSRMGQPKQHVKIGKKTFLEMILEKIEANKPMIDEIILVGRDGDQKAINLAKKHGLWISNPNPEKGPLSSIKLALTQKKLTNAILLWPVDHPLVKLATIKTLCSEFRKHPENIIVPSIDFRRGHPPIFPSDLQPDFFSIGENDGARKILQLYPERIMHILTNDIWVRKNINTPEILQKAKETLEKENQLDSETPPS
jgi:CTP:molybdopterin cytidylyltransferase MocA